MIQFQKTHIEPATLAYTGNELRPHFLYEHWGMKGNAIVAFIGPANVELGHMVDVEDRIKKAPIASDAMVHFLAEWFIDSLYEGVLLQHLFVAEVYSYLWESGVRGLSKRGNDIYFEGRKFNVSIATKTAVSVLMHAGFNVRNDGTPIPTAALSEMGISAEVFVHEVLGRFSRGLETWADARVKVMGR